jgi:peptidoglycan LD-endopeptidase CwlK
VTTGLRTYEQQNDLYSQGRTTEGGVVTNARGGESYHNFGLAVDVVPLTDNGGIDWGASQLEDGWSTIGNYGAATGLEWGGNWESFVDRPHFRDTLGGMTTDDLDGIVIRMNQMRERLEDLLGGGE